MRVDAPDSETVPGQAPSRWWHDRALLVLLAFFAALALLITYRIYASDEIQYFAYTHSLFFDQDLDFGNQYLHFYNSDRVKFQAIYEDLYLKKEPLTGLPLNVAPIGTGLFWLPGFAIAHGAAMVLSALGMDVRPDGYSMPYIVAICLTSYLLACAGLLLIYSIAKGLFGRRLSAVAVIVVWLATPLIFYTVVAPPWSHATSLFTVTLFIWYWYRTRTDAGRSLRQWAVLGALAGLMMLVREQDALFMVIPFVEVVHATIARRREKRAAIYDKRPNVLYRLAGLAVMGVAAAFVFIPQLVAYRIITGNFGPSKVVSGKFTWTSPNFLSVLFNPEHGMIPWTPLIAVALAGMLLVWRYDRVLTLGLFAAFFSQVYIAGSFLTWQSASSFGQRRFINSTAMFVLGVAAVVAWLMSNGVPRWATGALLALFVVWNGGLLMQYALWCSPQRQGLDWATVLRGQIELPGQAAGLIWDFLTNRERFYRRTTRC